MAELPEDVMTDILTCLPVKSLLRFRCVSKHFCTLIDRPYFIKRHLNRSLQTNSNHKLILRDRRVSALSPSSCFYSVDFDELDQTLELDNPYGTEILGSVNGLLCVGRGNDIVIWNFATRNFQKLPKLEIDISGINSVSTVVLTIAYSFGYDSISDNYKLLRLVQLNAKRSRRFNSEAKVYSLRSNSWQRIQGCPYYIYHGKHIGVLVCGALHWVMLHEQGSDYTHLIVAFDLATNEYKQVDHPEFLKKGPSNVTKLEGCLCLPCFSSEQVDVWVMNDYGVKDSWSKLLSVSQPGVINSFEFVIPLSYSKSGTEIMLVQEMRRLRQAGRQDNKRLLWYSLRERTVRSIYLRGCPDDFLPEVCVESLVPLSGKVEVYTKENGEEGAKEKQIKGKKKRNGFLSQVFKFKL